MNMATEIERYRQAGSEFVLAARSGVEKAETGGNGSWGATEIAHHLADADLHFAIRIREILVHDNPALVFFAEEGYGSKLNYADRPIEPALLLIKMIHEETADLLTTLPEQAWSRGGARADGLNLTLADVVRKSIDHTKEHIDQVANLKSAL
ncbi:MAG TPA: hypothetical protein VMV52_06965 [Candidatus Nanopelagicaceae bacterium]|nr:hypothetical protein [Candidatus Nanopelagicaceae bacterium]